MEDSDSDDAAAMFNNIASRTALILAAAKNRTRKTHGGSRQGRATNRDIGRTSASIRLDSDYFCRDGGLPVFTGEMFERRHRMPRLVYEIIREGMLPEDSYFEQKFDAAGAAGASTDQQVTAAMRQLSLGIGADAIVEYVKISESTAAESLKRFCRAVVSKFKAEFLNQPTEEDLRRVEKTYASLGFPGCIGCLDCASWELDKCPVAWQGNHKGKDKKPSCRMEVVCDDSFYS
jgi:hypothetical protein